VSTMAAVIMSVRNTFMQFSEEADCLDIPEWRRTVTIPADIASEQEAEVIKDQAHEADEATMASEGEGEEEGQVSLVPLDTRDFFENIPKEGLPLGTLDPFKDALRERFGRASAKQAAPAAFAAAGAQAGTPQRGAPLASPAIQTSGQEPQLATQGARTGDAPAHTATPFGGSEIRYKVRNTFVDISDDEGEETPRSTLRRSGKARTMPTRLFTEASEAACTEGLPTLLQRLDGLPACELAVTPITSSRPLPAAEVAMDAAYAAAAAAATVAIGPSAAMKPLHGQCHTRPSEAPIAGQPSTTCTPLEVQAKRSTPQLMRGLADAVDAGATPKRKVSVRNTSLHDSGDDDDTAIEEGLPDFGQQVCCSKREPAQVSASTKRDDGHNNAACAGCVNSEPCKVPTAAGWPEASALPGLTAWEVAFPPGMGVPVALPLGVLLPFLQGVYPPVPLLAQPSATLAGSVPAGVRTPRDAQLKAGAGKVSGSSCRRSGSERTTVVLQNLPLNYRRHLLLRMLDKEGFAGQYDFVYFPVDFKTGSGIGYAFINLVDPAVVPRFWHAFDGFKKWIFPCAKICCVSWSMPHQGLKSHIKRYQNSSVMHESIPDEYKPMLLSGGVRIPFPGPTKKLVAPSHTALVGASPGSKL